MLRCPLFGLFSILYLIHFGVDASFVLKNHDRGFYPEYIEFDDEGNSWMNRPYHSDISGEFEHDMHMPISEKEDSGVGMKRGRTKFDFGMGGIGLGKRMDSGKRRTKFDYGMGGMGLGKRTVKFDSGMGGMGLGKRSRVKFDSGMGGMGLGKRPQKLDFGLGAIGLGKRQQKLDFGMGGLGLGKRSTSKFDYGMGAMGIGKRMENFGKANLSKSDYENLANKLFLMKDFIENDFDSSADTNKRLKKRSHRVKFDPKFAYMGINKELDTYSTPKSYQNDQVDE